MRSPRHWPDIPFAPRRWPFFYGWVIVAGGILGALASVPGQTVGVGVFREFLMNTMGVSLVQISMAYMAGTVLSSFALPYAGRLLDRAGCRVMVVFSSVGLGASVLLIAQVEHIAPAGRFQSVAPALVVATVMFLLVRFFGQGCLTLVSRVVLGKWFNHRRGLATAVTGVFVSFGFWGSPALLNGLIGAVGWREACLALAFGIGGGMAVLGWLIYRDNPEECGLVMDGVDDPDWHARMIARVPETCREFTRRDAVRTPAFWAFSLALSCHGLLITALTFQVELFGAEMGLNRAESFAIFLYLPYFSVVSNFVCGWVSDKVPLKWLLFVMMGSEAAGTAGLLAFHDAAGWWLMAGGYGVAGGCFGTLVTVTWPRFFGRKHLGAVSGLNMSIMVFSSALGPVLFSFMRGLTGSYFAVTLGWFFVPVLLLVFALFADNPQPRC